MKRYTHDYDYGSSLKASPNGIWVKYEDAKRLIELNREMYEALLNILHLKAVDELDEELWTKAWAIGVDAIRAANGEKAEEVKGNDK